MKNRFSLVIASTTIFLSSLVTITPAQAFSLDSILNHITNHIVHHVTKHVVNKGLDVLNNLSNSSNSSKPSNRDYSSNSNSTTKSSSSSLVTVHHTRLGPVVDATPNDPLFKVKLNDDTIARLTPTTTDQTLQSLKVLPCKIVKVYDGDTAHCQYSNGNIYKIRFFGIDAPEAKETFGKESGDWLRKQILNQTVYVAVSSVDLYHRVLGTVFFNGQNMNYALAKTGHAQVYIQARKSSPLIQKYLAAEASAKQAGIGLWNKNLYKNGEKLKNAYCYRHKGEDDNRTYIRLCK